MSRAPFRTLHEEKSLSFLEHLEEMRKRLIICAIAIIIGVVIGMVVANSVNQILIGPFVDSGMIKVATQDHRNSLRITVDKDGTAHLVLPEGLMPDPEGSTPPATVDRNPTDSITADKKVPPPPATIDLLEFFRAGEDQPIAVFKSGRDKSALGYFRPLDPFVVYFKTALLLGLIMATPIMAWQAYGFVSPGLLERERKTVVPLFIASAILFPIGSSFAFFMMKYFIYFMASYSIPDVLVFNDIRAYLNFVLTMIVVFGILFELPVVVVLLTKIGIVTPDQLAAKRKYVFVGILVVAAALTPGGEPISMLILSLPLYILFEGALIFSRFGHQHHLVEAIDGADPDGEKPDGDSGT